MRILITPLGESDVSLGVSWRIKCAELFLPDVLTFARASEVPISVPPSIQLHSTVTPDGSCTLHYT